MSFILAPATPAASAATDAPSEAVASTQEEETAEQVAVVEPDEQPNAAPVPPESTPETEPGNETALVSKEVDASEEQIADAPSLAAQPEAIDEDTVAVLDTAEDEDKAEDTAAELAPVQTTDSRGDTDTELAQQQTAAEQGAPTEEGLNLTQTLGEAAADTRKHAAANIAVVRSSESVPAQAPAIALEGQADAPRRAVSDPAPEAETSDPPKPAAVAVLKAGPDGIEVVQPAGAGQAALSNKIALDTISYSAAGEVVLAGRARPESLVRIYVDNAPWADITTAPSGNWQGEIEGLKPGVYTLRLDELDPLEGKVISRLETPFSRAEPEQLALSTSDADPNRPSVRAVTVQEGDT
ncbi:MAG: hypothetical protein AAGF86_20035, partial [Pseudomonadota bacterium]